jgi:prepilin-type N-terminal cleavage/methylation domain-containing protein
MLSELKSLPRRQAGALGRRKYKAFTLIELLIVIVIIGILAGFVVFTVRSATLRARDARAKNSVRSVQTALESWLTDNTSFLSSYSAGTWYSASSLGLKDPTGAPLLTGKALDGQDNEVQVKFSSTDPTYYVIKAVSGTDKTKCWYASPTANNLSASVSVSLCTSVN